jgi:hypothetical protein
MVTVPMRSSNGDDLAVVRELRAHLALALNSSQFSTKIFHVYARLCEHRENYYRRNTNKTSILAQFRAQQ